MAAEALAEKELQTAQLEQALAHVETLQHQLDSLRFAIPDMVRPLTVSRPGSRAEAARNVRDSAIRTTSQMKDFREAWKSEQTQSMLVRVRQSAAENRDLSKAAHVPAWGWSDAR